MSGNVASKAPVQHRYVAGLVEDPGTLHPGCTDVPNLTTTAGPRRTSSGSSTPTAHTYLPCLVIKSSYLL